MKVINGIAVIVLERKVEFHPHIAPICLPEVSDDAEYQNNYQGCVVTGWGKNSFCELTDNENLLILNVIVYLR
jgi:hypothetical protein